MANSYQTPGVYVEEIPKFPPSIAAVETAIPVFIGYTEKAIRNGELLFNKPTRIESIAEFELLFGGAPSQKVTIHLDTNNHFVKAENDSKLYLYDSLRMFYANGGGNCYILSVGKYPAAVDSSAITGALAVLELEDEPTIILAPDVVSAQGGPYEFQKQALAQCDKLKDRVTLCDLTKCVTNDDFKKSVSEFRNKIGINYLKYGAAYGPWVNANLPRTLLRRDISLVSDISNTPILLSSLTSDSDLQKLIADLLSVENYINSFTDETVTQDPDKTLDDKFKDNIDAFKNIPGDDPTNKVVGDALKVITDFIIDILVQVQKVYSEAPDPETNLFKLKKDIDEYIPGSGMKASLTTLGQHHKYLSTLPAKKISILNDGTDPAVPDINSVALMFGFTDWSAVISDPNLSDEDKNRYKDLTSKERGIIALTPVLVCATGAINLFNFVKTTQKNYEKTINDALIQAFGAYKDLVIKATEALNILPPSGSVAGVYAATDRDRGVWKAPANVSLNNVVSPSVKISHEQQAEFNIDVNSGKSVNIIRSFTGKGVLVWGARTLAGNDNEWRYINVRRFFNFVEESVKKATEHFVFEPNDANTWVKVQAMIENFLTLQWRQGALQGVKPEHAFYVSVGLGKTMTALDILEGRMVIEIGMAAVRPAEFIILRFSHKMAES
jgi:hypothetical protein